MGDSGVSVAVFWISISFIFYTYIGYPLLLALRAYWRTNPIRKDPTYAPTTTFLIIAHNEEGVIRQKLENTLSLECSGQRLDVVVASDGSTDRTNEIVTQFGDKGVRLLAYASRMGKTYALNAAIPLCHSEIIILSDARQIYASSAVRELVANFADPRIGAVTGDLQFQPSPDSKDGERISLYWKYEKWIRRHQTHTDSTPVVTGAIYAIRKSLFRPLPRTCIADDLAMPMSIIMQGSRVTFDPEAKAFDRYSRTLQDEFRRRVRTIAGSYQYLFCVPQVLNPKANRIWLDFISHKTCRVIAPFALFALLVANLSITTWPYSLVLILQMTFYMLAGLGAVLANRGTVPRVLSAPYTFLMLNIAAGVALFQLISGAQTHLWEKTKVG
jgi:cellulose synthase/poly-beta-1,6-N-acetylglucosamine synthase-like glycosyltransferase